MVLKFPKGRSLESAPMQNNRFVFQESIFRDDLKNSYDHNRIEKSFCVRFLWQSHDEAPLVHLILAFRGMINALPHPTTDKKHKIIEVPIISSDKGHNGL